MTQRPKYLFVWSIAGVAVIVAISLAIRAGGAPGRLDVFAQCLETKGAIFYGAFWCPHCQNQKTMFGRSAKYLPYVECSTPDGKTQLAICREKAIKGYPTWEFPDGSRESGEVSLDKLSEKTGCELPK